jgi:distribution and morphology protein 12
MLFEISGGSFQLCSPPSSARMSVDLDWEVLDEELAKGCLGFLQRAFKEARRPSYLDEVEVTSFAFGSEAPSVEIVEVRDVYREFVEAEDEAEMLDAEAERPPPPSLRRLDDLGRAPTVTSVPPLHTTSSTSTRPFSQRHPSPVPPLSSQEESDRARHQKQGRPRPPPLPPPSTNAPLSLQLHLRVLYSGTMRIGLRTALLVHYPSPQFMALPLALSVTGLAFAGTVVIAYEGEKRRVHVSVLDEAGGDGRRGPRAGERLLSALVIESEVGEADRHVLRNVGKVEKFVLEVARRTLEVCMNQTPLYRTASLLNLNLDRMKLSSRTITLSHSREDAEPVIRQPVAGLQFGIAS